MRLKKLCITTLAFLSLISLASCKKKKDAKVTTNVITTNNAQVDEKYNIYLLAQQAGFNGTYEEWLETIKGKDGKGILSITKTNSEGYVDTYTITFTDNTTTTFTITNGSIDNEYVSVWTDEDDILNKETMEINGKIVTNTRQIFLGEWINISKKINEYNNKRELVMEESYDFDEESDKWLGEYKFGYSYNNDELTTFVYDWIDATDEWKLGSKEISVEVEDGDFVTTTTEIYDYVESSDSWTPNEKILRKVDEDDDEVQRISYSWASGLNDWSESYQKFRNLYFETDGEIYYDWNNEDNGWVDATMTVTANLYRDDNYLFEYVILKLRWVESENGFVVSEVTEMTSEDGTFISYTDTPINYGVNTWRKQYYYEDNSGDDYTRILYNYVLDLDNFAIRPDDMEEYEYKKYYYGYEHSGYGMEIPYSHIICRNWNYDLEDWNYKEIIKSELDEDGKINNYLITTVIDGVEKKQVRVICFYDADDMYIYNYYQGDWDDEQQIWTSWYINRYSYDESGRLVTWTQVKVNDGGTEINTFKEVYTYDDDNQKVTSVYYVWSEELNDWETM